MIFKNLILLYLINICISITNKIPYPTRRWVQICESSLKNKTTFIKKYNTSDYEVRDWVKKLEKIR